MPLTHAQLEAIKRMVDDVDAMIGCGDSASDGAWERNVNLIDKMLKKNGLSRHFKEKECGGEA
ncbi:hypothetical protein [Cronobacter sakazakii]|uniref:hypothetical protein n=1 Tax=Cronobacter sakazakii TaxID=28141 RepID=UPI000CFB9603|nr:hypothetical protein [Cronobacter sakazakii]ELY3763470.1 hypothetical protein [Cronobacter sakazakii]